MNIETARPGWFMKIALERLVTVLLLGFASLGLVVPGWSNASLFLLALCGVAAWSLRDGQDAMAWRDYRVLCLVMALPLLAVLIHQVGLGDHRFQDYDRPLRLALFVLVLLALRRLPAARLAWLPWAWSVALVLCFAKAWVITEGGTLPNSGSLGFMAGIAFSNMALLLAAWLLLSLTQAHGRLDLLLRVLAIVLACGVTFMIKTRGTWLVLPFYAVFFICYLRHLKVWHKLLILALPVLVLAVAMAGSSMVRERIYDVHDNLVAYADGSNRDTSVGQRLEVWRGSWMMFQQYPWLGVGRENFKPELHSLAGQGRISPSVVELPHSHNGMLFQMALWGMAGLVAWWLVYLVPLVMFCRALRHPAARVRSYAAMGATMCIGFWVFDLTDVMFFWVILNGFYAINLALFLLGMEHARRAWDDARRPASISMQR